MTTERVYTSDMTTHGITQHAQRGTLTYMKLDYTWRIVDGWFYLNGDTVVMRKMRGRNWFNLCNAQHIHDFEINEEGK